MKCLPSCGQQNWNLLTCHRLNAEGFFHTEGRYFDMRTKTYSYLHNKKSNELFFYESRNSIRWKAIKLLCVIRIYGEMNFCYNGAVCLKKIFWDRIFRRGDKEKIPPISSNIGSMIKTPFFIAGMIPSLLVTICAPYYGRNWVSACQSFRFGSPKNDFRFGMEEDDCDDLSCGDFFRDFYHGKVLFPALCMQSVGKLGAKVNNQAQFHILKKETL